MTSPDTDILLDRIQCGEKEAVSELLQNHRPRLKKLVTWRLDPRVAGRVDASDVLQNALAQAAQRISEYASTRPVPIQAWLRRLVIDAIVDVHREHIRSQKRSVSREMTPDPTLSDFGRKSLASLMIAKEREPADALEKQEQLETAQRAIEQLNVMDREVLVLRYLEQLSVREAAGVLGISENAFSQRHLRALRRLKALVSAGGDASHE